MEINVNFKENVDLGKLFSGVAKKVLLAAASGFIVVGGMNISANTDKPKETTADTSCTVVEDMGQGLRQLYNFKSGQTYVLNVNGSSAPTFRTIDEVTSSSKAAKKHVEQLKLKVPGLCFANTHGA